jgi:hypothetical protein
MHFEVPGKLGRDNSQHQLNRCWKRNEWGKKMKGRDGLSTHQGRSKAYMKKHSGTEEAMTEDSGHQT